MRFESLVIHNSYHKSLFDLKKIKNKIVYHLIVRLLLVKNTKEGRMALLVFLSPLPPCPNSSPSSSPWQQCSVSTLQSLPVSALVVLFQIQIQFFIPISLVLSRVFLKLFTMPCSSATTFGGVLQFFPLIYFFFILPWLLGQGYELIPNLWANKDQIGVRIISHGQKINFENLDYLCLKSSLSGANLFYN